MSQSVLCQKSNMTSHTLNAGMGGTEMVQAVTIAIAAWGGRGRNHEHSDWKTVNFGLSWTGAESHSECGGGASGETSCRGKVVVNLLSMLSHSGKNITDLCSSLVKQLETCIRDSSKLKGGQTSIVVGKQWSKKSKLIKSLGKWPHSVPTPTQRWATWELAQ